MIISIVGSIIFVWTGVHSLVLWLLSVSLLWLLCLINIVIAVVVGMSITCSIIMFLSKQNIDRAAMLTGSTPTSSVQAWKLFRV